MSHSSQHQPPSLSLCGFGGINRTAYHTQPSCAEDILNFRILEDGSLKKRNGYRQAADFKAPIRAFWNGTICGESRTYVLIQNQICTVHLSTGEIHEIGTIGTSDGTAHFFFYQGTLFLSDGSAFYEIHDSVPRICNGYVPLIGKDWSNRQTGSVYEPRNLLNRRARISYIISDPPTLFLAVPEKVESVDAVYLNGTPLSSELYCFDETFQTVNVQGLSAGDRVLVFLTFTEQNQKLLQALCSCMHSVLFGSPNRNRLFFWGGQMPSVMFCSAYVGAERQTEAQLVYTDSNGLYFPEGFEFRVGEGRCAIHGAERYYDRLLIFTESDTWMAQEGASGMDEFPTVPVHASIGCASQNGSALADGTPISVGDYGVWRWSGSSDRPNEQNAERISQAIDDSFSPESYRTAKLYYFQRHNEIWLYRTETEEVFLYHPKQKTWVRWNGIAADDFFEADGQIGFLRDGKLFLFESDLTRDYESESEIRPICAVYQSGITDFGSDSKKALARAVLHADIRGGALRLSFSGCGTETVSRSFAPSDHEHSIVSRRMASGRFRHGTFCIRADGETQAVIHSLTLLCR